LRFDELLFNSLDSSSKLNLVTSKTGEVEEQWHRLPAAFFGRAMLENAHRALEQYI
jgi:hypothetical protein